MRIIEGKFYSCDVIFFFFSLHRLYRMHIIQNRMQGWKCFAILLIYISKRCLVAYHRAAIADTQRLQFVKTPRQMINGNKKYSFMKFVFFLSTHFLFFVRRSCHKSAPHRNMETRFQTCKCRTMISDCILCSINSLCITL